MTITPDVRFALTRRNGGEVSHLYLVMDGTPRHRSLCGRSYLTPHCAEYRTRPLRQPCKVCEAQVTDRDRVVAWRNEWEHVIERYELVDGPRLTAIGITIDQVTDQVRRIIERMDRVAERLDVLVAEGVLTPLS